jgi:hypothetical protein
VGLADAVKADKPTALEAIRDRLAAELAGDDCPNVPAVAKQLVDVLERLSAIQPPEESTVDDIAAQRAKRRRSTSAPDAPAGAAKQRPRGRASGGKRRAAP